MDSEKLYSGMEITPAKVEVDIFALANDITSVYRSGMESQKAISQREESQARNALRHVLAMHERYPDTVLPQPFLAALVAAKGAL